MWKIAFVNFLVLVTIIGVRISDVVGSTRCKAYQGAALLALAHPKFPLNDAIKLLRPLDCPAVSVLYRTFGHKLSRISTLQQGVKKRMKALIYGDCGPCRYPRRPKNYAPHFRPDLSIDDFNKQISTSRSLRRQFVRKVILPPFRFIRANSNRGIIFEYIAILEDNLSPDAWNVVSKLQKTEKRKLHLKVRLRRNPLIYQRNPGWPIEVHTCAHSAPEYLWSGDSISYDGVHVAFNGERGNCRAEDVGKIADNAYKNRIDTYLWRAPWQGLLQQGTKGVSPPIPLRTFTLDYIKESIKLLRNNYEH